MVTNQRSTHMCMWSICRLYPRPSLCEGWIHPHKAWKNERYLCQSHERGLLWCWNRAETSVGARREHCEQSNHNWWSRSIRCKSTRIIGAQGLAELVKIFNPHAKTSLRLLKDAYKYHESLKKIKLPTYLYKSNRAASARSFLTAPVVPHRELRRQCSA